jgi:Sigma2 domain of PhyR
VLPLEHPGLTPRPLADRVGVALEAPPMNGRHTYLAESIANSTARLEAYIPGLRRFARALLRGDREWADDLVQHTSNARCQVGDDAGPKTICAVGFIRSYITVFSAIGTDANVGTRTIR